MIIDNKNISVKKLKIFTNSKGNVFLCYKEKVIDKKIKIKEIYFTEIKYKKIKGWIKHKKISCNFVVPVGRIKFMFLDEKKKKITKIIVGKNNYRRISVPKNIWFAFEGLAKPISLVVNYLDKINDNNDVLKKKFTNL
tara:strand:- start:495 stop:908 length:414 start_codon:yes stop_codon:yes gene_type:complete